ncbi:TetR family transcriptional regulator [Actinomadura rubrisoli]|uniref:TetR/AcrR family transcriptional regulator n=1 Tax=Actinomadura rubrisoli TaxID=2530368 RepID=A0A4R5BNT6_9ACTN|nr:TetR family transcriptional regulator [Actinomadura rubrisoli]TDD88528.1 TetR/AcrR family transcriptional regulator [Actinomadura rubrisoli]
MNERSSKRRTKVLASREVVFASALQAFAELGFHGASMRDIANRAGMSLSNLYNHAPSKSDLLVELLKTANYNHLSETEWAVSAAGPKAVDRLEMATRAYVNYILQHPLEALVAHTELRYLDNDARKRLVIARDRLEAIFENIVQEGVRAGEFHTPYPDDVARNLLSMCAGIAEWYRPDGPMTRDQIAEQFAHYAVRLVEQH